MASILTQHGIRARNLQGGMIAWGDLHVTTRVASPQESAVTLFQINRVGKRCLSYVIVSDHEALVIDPPGTSIGIPPSHKRSKRNSPASSTRICTPITSQADQGLPAPWGYLTISASMTPRGRSFRITRWRMVPASPWDRAWWRSSRFTPPDIRQGVHRCW